MQTLVIFVTHHSDYYVFIGVHNASPEGLLAVAVLWGATNPFIKRATKGIRYVKRNTLVSQFYAEIVYLATNWQYVVPFLLNQCGSVLFFFLLQSAQLSLAVPIANSMTFVFTALTSWCIGEKPLNKNSKLGILLIIVGVTLCYLG